MNFSVDEFLDRTFNLRSYNCWDFACEVWQRLTGQTISAKVEDFQPNMLSGAVDDHASKLTRLEAPVSPCLVLMQRPRSMPHIGVFVRGRVLHLNERGAWCQPIHQASAGFTEVSYYR